MQMSKLSRHNTTFLNVYLETFSLFFLLDDASITENVNSNEIRMG